ncbi:sulfotransferase 6B1-like isoform X1 [Ascaphus truei]|uniref:sulfotransferase 6B1-like isoform X1 n=1 Tax=Ascaphus truei TaxID=8439 RepID=UPI003F5A7E31
MTNRVKIMQEMQEAASAAEAMSPDKLLFPYKGVLYPRVLCSAETFEALGSFESREDDVMLVSYPKCGSNWTLQLLQDMVYSIHDKEPPAIIPKLEFGSPDKFEKLKQESSPRVLATHLFYDDLPKSFFDKKVKMLLLIRNPKDTAVSLFHFYNNNPVLPPCSSWDTFFQDFMSGKVCFGSYFDQAVAWNKHIDDEGVMIITFEEMKKDLDAAIKKISEFFGISLTEEQIQLIAKMGTFKSMKEKSTKSDVECLQVIFRKGEVGDWKNYFTEAQNQEMDARFEECLAGTKLGEMINYNVHCKS